MLNQVGVNYSVADKGKLSNLNRSLKEMLDGSKCSDWCGTGTTGNRGSGSHTSWSAAREEQPLSPPHEYAAAGAQQNAKQVERIY